MPTYIAWKTPLLMKIDRVAKFKQRSQLTQNPYLKGLPGVAGGACVGATFAWLNRHLQSPAESPRNRAAFLSLDDTWCRISVYCSAFNSTLILDHINRIKANLPNICGRQDSSSTVEYGEQGLSGLVTHINATQPGYYVWEFTFESTEKMSTHVCGLYADKNGMSFFDPNSGEYRIRPDKKLEFLQKLYKHYLNYVSGTGAKKALKMDELYLVQLGG